MNPQRTASGRRLLCGAFVALLALTAGCTEPTSTPAQADEEVNATTFQATATEPASEVEATPIEPVIAETATVRSHGSTRQALDAAFRDLLAVETIAYRLRGETSMPMGFGTASSFDRLVVYYNKSREGTGGTTFTRTVADRAALDELVDSGEVRQSSWASAERVESEFRLVDEISWNLLRAGDATGLWTGMDPNVWPTSDEVSSGGGLNGGYDLFLLLEALVGESTATTTQDGSTTWDVNFDADILGPHFGVGAARRLLDAGLADETGILASGHLFSDASGMIVSADVDLSDWWTAGWLAGSGLEERPDGFEVQVFYTMDWAEEDQMISVVAPCLEPALVAGAEQSFWSCGE